MKVNDEVMWQVAQDRKLGYLPSRFKPGYWINDTEAAFEQWLHEQGYRPESEIEGKQTVIEAELSPKLVNQFAPMVDPSKWTQVCVFASRLKNLHKLQQD